MKAIVIKKFGNADGLKIVNIQDPIPQKGEVIIDIETIGLGTQDVMIRSGALSSYGFKEGYILGSEVVGIVSQLGEAVDKQLLGQRVWAFIGQRGYAEKAVAIADQLVVVPEGISPQAAVAVAGSAVVAKFGLERGGLKAENKLLIRGAGGPIGVMAVQLAKIAGLKTIAITASSEERKTALHKLGATKMLDRNGKNKDGKTDKYDVILDIVGGSEISSFFEQLAPNGHLVLVGNVAGMPPENFAAPMLLGFQKSWQFSTFSANPNSIPDIHRKKAVETFFQLMLEGRLQSVIDATFSFDEVVEAHQYLEKGGLFGKEIMQIQ